MKKKLFIAYHGTYDETGSLRKAEEIYQYLKNAGVDCYLFSSLSGTNDVAFTNTPEIATQCEKFLLVCNEHIRTDEDGLLLNNGVLQEVRAFWKRVYSNESKDGDARVYTFGKFSDIDASRLHLLFKGVAHFSELRNNGKQCYEEVLEWVKGNVKEKEEEEEKGKDLAEDIRLRAIRLFKKSEYGLSPVTYNEKLLPKLAYDGGGEVLENILSLKPEEGKTYVLYANGGSGKSYSLKSFWMASLDSEYVPLYVSVRTCDERYGSYEHPLYEYISSLYIPSRTASEIADVLREEKQKWLLLLDGYNEVEEIGKIESDLVEIEDDVTILVTARDKSFVTGLNSNTMSSLKVLPLEERVVRDYIRSYKDPQLLSLLGDANMIVMLRNPMLLTMFCNAFDESSYHFHMDAGEDVLTPGELIEKCVVAQLRKSDSTHARTFLSILCLFPMVIADMYYEDHLTNMTVSRIDLTKAYSSFLSKIDVDSLEAFYLPEYAARWDVDLSEEEMEEMVSFLRERKPLEIRNELSTFERVMSKVLQFFSVDSERSRVGGGLYRFDHQTSLNWYIAYGIYNMADLSPERFEEILGKISDGIDVMSENTDDLEEQGEFLFDLIRDYAGSENYRHFAVKLFERHFARKTSRIYEIATGCVKLFDASNVTDEEYAEEVSSFCFSQFSLGKRNTPQGMREEDIVEEFGKKLEKVIKKAERIKDPETRDVTIAKINTIQGAYELAKYRLYKQSHEASEETERQLSEYLKKAEEYQLTALRTREKVLSEGSGRYQDEMACRIAHSYTSLGTIAFYLKDYDLSIKDHQIAYEKRKELMKDRSVGEEWRNDARVRIPINLNRINGSLLTKGDITKDVLLDIFERELLLSDTLIEAEMINQVNNFQREIPHIGYDEELLRKAEEVYSSIRDSFGRLFGYQSEKVISLGEELHHLREEKEERIRKEKENIYSFFNSDAFQSIVKIFNNGKEIHDLKEIKEFAKNWDYRQKMAAGGERQAVTEEDGFVKKHREELIGHIRDLGMIDEKKEEFEAPDYILPLGGYGLTNLRRCLLAKKVLDRYPEKEISIVALSSHRPILKEEEFKMTEEFAPGAVTEYEEMAAGMKKAFGLNEVKDEEVYGTEGERDYWKKTEYVSEDGNHYFDLSAPCTDEKKTRANTEDTFIHFLKCFKAKKGDRVFLISTSLYEPYQYYSLLPSAIEAGIGLVFIGGSYKEKEEDILATLCLQDLKSGVDAMSEFLRKYE